MFLETNHWNHLISNVILRLNTTQCWKKKRFIFRVGLKQSRLDWRPRFNSQEQHHCSARTSSRSQQFRQCSFGSSAKVNNWMRNLWNAQGLHCWLAGDLNRIIMRRNFEVCIQKAVIVGLLETATVWIPCGLGHRCVPSPYKNDAEQTCYQRDNWTFNNICI